MATRLITADATVRMLASFQIRRLTLAIYNGGGATVRVGKDQASLDTIGWPILAGGSLSLVKRDGDEPEGPWYVLGTAATQALSIVEGFGE